MFGGTLSQQTTTIGNSSNRRLIAFIAVGGASVIVATTFWMYNRRKNKSQREASLIESNEMRRTNNESTDEVGAKMTLINSSTADLTSKNDDDKLISTNTNSTEEMELEQEKKSDIVESKLSKNVELEACEDNDDNGSSSNKCLEMNTNRVRDRESSKVQQQTDENQANAATGENSENLGASIEEFIRGHVSEPLFNWAELVDAEEQKQEQKSQSAKTDKKETEGKATKTEGSCSKTKFKETDEEEQMLPQVCSRNSYHGYSGRGSTGSTGTLNRQHPVNSICTCTQCVEVLSSLQSSRGYKNADSPHSTQSEGSADSGRATGPLTSYSPFADAIAELGQAAADILPIYEFEVPNTLVGLIIGVKGKTIKELCTRANVRMLIRPHHGAEKYESHQICSVEGRRENINKCLHMIRLRFPPCRFPDLNLKPVLPPPPTNNTATATSGGTIRGAPSALTLPVGVPSEIYISAHVDAGHFFLQLPTHPSFASLALLDQYMLSVYTQPGGAPNLPKPCNVGVLCAAPAYNGWFRAITLAYDQEQDEMLVRFVDYGGFARLPRADLRQIRTDFMSLPLQGIECYLANVQPADGTLHWNDRANELFQQLCISKIIQAALVGYCKSDGIPYVELYVLDENKKTIRVDHELLERGLAKPIDPTKMVRTPLIG